MPEERVTTESLPSASEGVAEDIGASTTTSDTLKDERPAPQEPVADESASSAGGSQEPPVTATGEGEAPQPEPAPSKKRWYVVKVTSGREESIKEAIEKRVKIEGIDEFFGKIIIPVERVAEMRGGKRVVRERKLYPGYIMTEVEFNDRILYLFRETSGVGDFVGGGLHTPPQPMSAREVEQMLGRQGEPGPGRDVAPKPKYDRGDRVKVKDGTFAGMDGEVKELLEAKGAVKVELTIFGRPVPVELEYWQVEVV